MKIPCPHCHQMTAKDDTFYSCSQCGGSLIVCKNFLLVGLLGSGGMSTIYDAKRQSDNKPVAVKVLNLEMQDSWKSSELFERSTKVLQGLEHPQLPRIHAFEQDVRGQYFMVRDRYDGGTLKERLKDQGGRLGPEQFLALLTSLLNLLDYLHSRIPPVIHRDIKPENIMFTTPRDWLPVLVDFDTIATPHSDGLTLVGTPGYASPEQFAGDALPASDLYSLGATMVFVATHIEPDQIPRQGGKLHIDSILGRVGVSSPIIRIISKMLEPTLEKRYKKPGEVLYDLQKMQSNAKIQANPQAQVQDFVRGPNENNQVQIRPHRRAVHQGETIKTQAVSSQRKYIPRQTAVNTQTQKSNKAMLPLLILAFILFVITAGVGVALFFTLARKAESPKPVTTVSSRTVEKADQRQNFRQQVETKPRKAVVPQKTTKPLPDKPSSLPPQKLTKKSIMDAIRSNSGKIHDCNLHQNSEELMGTIKVKFVIERHGKVSSAKISDKQFQGTDIGGCVLNVVKGMRFGKFSGNTYTINWPFVIK